MKKKNYDGRMAEECNELNWVELSEKLESESSSIVNETLSQIASEDLKVDTSDMDGVRAAVDSFYAFDKKPAKKKKKPAATTAPVSDDPEQAIRRSVDEKIIIRSEELKKKRKSASKSKSEHAATVPKKKGKKHAASAQPNDSFRHAKGLDKYRKMGILPTKKDGPSAFRKKSANWRYDNVPEAPVTDEAIEQRENEETFIDRMKNMSAVQWVSVAMAAVILITSVMTTTVYAEYLGEQNLKNAMAGLPSFTDDASMIAYNADSFETEDVTMEEAAGEPGEVTGKMLSLVLTSVEKDLKVKLVDEEDTLVKGVRWGISVTDKDGNESDYEDDDEDGIIHLTGMNAGDYSVAIKDSDSLSGFVYPTVGQTVSVKAKVEYKVIANIKDEIKKESEVNAAAEDNGNKAADVETGPALKDTVEFVESSKEENGESYEEATVDLSKTEVIASLGTRLYGALKDLADAATSMFSNDKVAALAFSPRMVAANTPEDENTSTGGENNTENTGNNENNDNNDNNENSNNQQSAHEHSYGDWTVTKEATCTEAGEKTRKCTGCDKTETATIEALGHKFENGKCTRCGASDPNYNKDCQHHYVETITREATCTEKGVKTFKCDKCGDWYTVDIPALGHDYKDGICTRCKAVDPDKKDQLYKDEAQLYDSNKNPLYVYVDGSYRLAKYADYKSGNFSKYYRKVVGYIYTGWQNIDGKSYYFTKDHEKVTGTQIIGGVEYEFNSDGSLNTGSGVLGIDVSKYQPSINWSSVKASGVDFVIIRCGYRGASTGALIEDPYFKSHIKGAKNAGLKVGVYFFSTALNEAEAVEEASMCAALCSGYGLSYPVFLDVESSSRPGYNTLSPAERTANIQAFCKTIGSAGYKAGLYANKTWLTEKINTSSLSCKIWLAQYNSSGPTYSGRYDIWQYTSKGHVDGISGNVDMNKSFLKY